MLPALLARGRSDVDDPVGVPDDVHLMLHDEERVSRALELIERLEQRLGVRRMEPRGGLVEHVHHAEQVGAHLGGEPQPLELAG